MASSTKILPIVTIQHDFETVIADVRDGTVEAEDFWLSCYRQGGTSVHGKVRVTLDGGEVVLTSRDGVQLDKERSHYYASCSSLSISRTRLRNPKHTIQDTEMPESRHNRQINSFDVSPDLAQIALGYNDGTIRRLPLSTHLHLTNGSGPSHTQTQPQVQPITYRPHVVAITSLRYFPSSRVLLAAGADFSLTILDANPSSTSSTADKPARTLKGHSRAVTDTVIIGRGRNVLSCAKDGTVRLWDVGGGQQIKMMGVKRYSGVNAMALGVRSSSANPNGVVADGEQVILDDREVETEDKVVYCALQSGAFEAIDLRTKGSFYHSFDADGDDAPTSQTPLMSIALDPSNTLLATGSSKGVVSLYDTRSLGSTLKIWQRNESSIENLAFLPNSTSNELAVVTEDGLPYIARIDPDDLDGIVVGAELVGGNCEAIRCVRAHSSGSVWTADEEGTVRGY